ncbi:hypothetical protein BBOMB_0734 [Bifidobacterium bombi DSM 19703]|uniref:Uncharacterized protein n=1 Tax=Bifidobacterium bombi DSM 19703 TaxID=1341695 RepID=A0A080N4H8_9BIFI|nr:hypothetical protein BBOMB_0734 [Bifidobacterium bombi DSM 19703]
MIVYMAVLSPFIFKERLEAWFLVVFLLGWSASQGRMHFSSYGCIVRYYRFLRIPTKPSRLRKVTWSRPCTI